MALLANTMAAQFGVGLFREPADMLYRQEQLRLSAGVIENKRAIPLTMLEQKVSHFCARLEVGMHRNQYLPCCTHRARC